MKTLTLDVVKKILIDNVCYIKKTYDAHSNAITEDFKWIDQIKINFYNGTSLGIQGLCLSIKENLITQVSDNEIEIFNSKWTWTIKFY